MTPELSVIIVSYNTKKLLRGCLYSLGDALRGVSSEIIIIDNLSVDGSADMIEKEFPEMRLFKNSRNLGFAKASNQGIRYAHGKYILLLNPDTKVKSGLFKDLIARMEGQDSIGLAGCKLLNPDGSLQLSCYKFPTAIWYILESLGLTRLWPVNRHFLYDNLISDKNFYSKENYVDYLMGACLLIERAQLEKTGPFDEDFFMYAEEADFCKRLSYMGKKVLYTPSVELYHYQGSSSSQDRAQEVYRTLHSRDIFFFKHHGIVANFVVTPFILFGAVARMLCWSSICLFSRSAEKKAYALKSLAGYKLYLGAFRPYVRRSQPIKEDGFDIVCLSTLDWNGLWARPQQVSSVLACSNRVLYVESFGMRNPQLRDTKRIITRFSNWVLAVLRGARRIKEGLYVYSPLLLPFHQVRILKKFNKAILRYTINNLIKKLRLNKPVLWIELPSDLALDLTAHIKTNFIVYDCIDEHKLVAGSPKEIASIEERIVKRADIVFATAHRLFEKMSLLKGDVHYMPNAANLEVMSAVHSDHTAVAEEIASIKRPILGFVGRISKEAVDINLLKYVAYERPDWSIVLVGPVHTDISSLRPLNNVHFLGRKDYRQLPSHIKVFDVCILPFSQNEFMAYANPIVMYDFLASGKPVVATNFPEVVQYSDVIKIGKMPAEFISIVEDALLNDTQNDVTLRIEFAKNNSWNKRVESMLDIIREKRAAKK